MARNETEALVQRCSVKKVVHRNFAKFTGARVSFLMKMHSEAYNFIKKENLAQVSPVNLAYSSSCNLTPPISRVLIGDTWFFAYPRDQCAATCLKNVRHSNIRRGKKLDFQLSHTQPLSEIAKNTFFTEHLWATASERCLIGSFTRCVSSIRGSESTVHKKLSFPLRISLVNVTKSAEKWRWKASFLVRCKSQI